MNGFERHILDFEILPTSNPKLLLFLDASEYYENPEAPMLKITAPGQIKYFTVSINPGKVNVLNSNSIGYTDILEDDCPVVLNDGIWKFTYMVCPYKYVNETKFSLRTTNIDNNIKRIYVMQNEICYKKEMVDIHILVESAKANCEFGFIDKANKDFTLAQKRVARLLEKLKDK